MKKLKISFLGLGTIGAKLMDYITENISTISDIYGIDIIINKVFVRDITKKRSIDISKLCLTTNPYEAIENADIVIECLGGNGVELTRELILSAIQEKKAIIMSSKKCLALYGKEIITAVNHHHAIFHYDATVGGSIPISSVFETMGKCEKIKKIYGICNGTSNYILNEMSEHNLDYLDALQKAIEKGYAENNPKEDVDGYDSLFKSIIMIGFGMNQWINSDLIKPISISTITNNYITKAKLNDYLIKPIFCIEQTKKGITVFIGPKEVHKDTLLATVKENNNIIIIQTSESQERAFYGQGAGAKPSASAMFDDFIKAIKEFT